MNWIKRKKKIGVFPDIDQFYRHMTGFQHLRYFAKISGVHKTRKQIESILIECGLATSIHKKVKTYSFGMKKKLGFAQAIVTDPELVILDEPTSGLDPESAIDMRKQIKTLNQNGTTVFMTSHNLNELEQISDRIGILKQGTITSIGSMDELRDQYSSSFTVQINGEFPSNIKGIKQLNNISSDKKRLTVEVENKAAISSLLENLLYQGALIYKVEHEQLTLEDIFLMEE
ncbi:ABC transporter ATP-binding protein [Bacillus sp. JCM 19041]|uniref:ABC transporter ATP-binding protein n=1 Tax=Bacillus sp. JCM 19041 TaxID=1460637 RepID=UPI0006CF4563